MKYKEFQVTVRTPALCTGGYYKDMPLTEFPPKYPVENNMISTYIPSSAGKLFSVAVENESTHDASIVFYVDGQMASVLLCYAKPKYNIVNCQGVQPQAGLLRRFVFSRVSLSDDANAAQNTSHQDVVGTIKVVIRRCIVMSYDAQGTYMQFDSESAIHEKTQKGLLDTKTALQAGESYQDGPYAKVVYLDHGLPCAEFIFNYKSLDLLQAMGVAPPARLQIPKGVPNQKRSRVDNEGTLREENKRLKIELSRVQRQQTEPLESTPSTSKAGTIRKIIIKKEIEIVDLTDD